MQDLFRGYEKAHGCYKITGVGANGKQEGQAFTQAGGATEKDWNLHLTGTQGLGIIALMESNKVCFGAIDVDIYNLDHKTLEKNIVRHNFPLVLCRSKSGGAHLFLFTQEPVSAEIMQDKLSIMAATLGYGKSEIFPKQTYRVNEHDIGNWLNMPYFDKDKTLRYCIKDGKALKYQEFLEYANSKKVSLEDLQSLDSTIGQDKDDIFLDGPPCLSQIRTMGGFPSGTRNEGMFSVGVYLRKRFPDTWETEIMKYNTELCNPPLNSNEMQTLVKSLNKKGYDFKCKVEPLCSNCNSKLCRKRQFGIGVTSTSSNFIEIENITKVDGDPILWFVSVQGQRLMLTTDELFTQASFNKKCMEKINRVPGTMQKQRWEKYLDEVVSKADIVSTPKEASTAGQLEILLEKYLLGNAQAKSKQELCVLNTPYFSEEDDEMWFTSFGLFDYLQNHNFKYASKNHLWQSLRELGCDNKQVNVDGKCKSIWYIKKKDSIKLDIAQSVKKTVF